MEIYISKLTFYRKPKWSVWSIRTTFMRYLSKSVTQKSSFRRKLTFSKNDHVKKYKNVIFGPKKAPAACPADRKQLLNTFRNIPDPNCTKLCPQTCIFRPNLMRIRIFREKSLKKNIFYSNSKLGLVMNRGCGLLWPFLNLDPRVAGMSR